MSKYDALKLIILKLYILYKLALKTVKYKNMVPNKANTLGIRKVIWGLMEANNRIFIDKLLSDKGAGAI